MKYGSICSGIGAPECAWSALGWHCEFAAEIEAFPSAVYSTHYPKVPNYGDITKFKAWPQHAIDILVGGTPCQSFSVAGLRKGMADPRGNLAITFLAIVGKYSPAWVVWENVPGVLSIDEGRAFGSFLGGLAELGYGFAYRVLDAQYFGVAQRRRRVFVVGHAGGQWQRAAAVLFERESMCGNPAPSRETGQRIAPTISSRTKGGGGLGTDVDCDDKSHANSGAPPAIAFNVANLVRRAEASPSEDTFGTIGATKTGDAAPCVAFHQNQRAEVTTNETAGALNKGGGKPGQGYPAIQSGYAVRRLTPTECERLQGFPDGWTAIQYRGKPACDGPRYKALGNSMAVPVLKWIGERIGLVSEID